MLLCLSPATMQSCLRPVHSRTYDSRLNAGGTSCGPLHLHIAALCNSTFAPRNANDKRIEVMSRCLHAWLRSRACDDGCLLVGTSDGHLQLHAGATGALLHRQRLHGSACLALRPRVAGAGLCPEDAAEDVTAVFRDALARVSALEASAPMQA